MSPERKRKGPVQTSALPPHSPEMEAGLLGCCLLDSMVAMNACEEARVTVDWFYELRHRMVWSALEAQHGKGLGSDAFTVWQWLKDKGLSEQLGPEGLQFISGLPDFAPSAGNVTYWLPPLRELARKRAILRACGEALASVDDSELEVNEVLSDLDKKIAHLLELGRTRKERSFRELVKEAVQDLEDYHRGGAQMRGLATGLSYVDKFLCGIGGENGNYLVLSGRPGTGKTSLAMQIAIYLAKDFAWFEPERDAEGKLVREVDSEGRERIKTARRVGVPVQVYSMEMKDRALVKRVIFQRARADMQRFRTGYAESADLPALAKAGAELMMLDNVFVDDEGRMTIEMLRAKARRAKRQHGIKCFIVDYVQLLSSVAKRFRQDRVQELAEISAEIAALGKELDTLFIVLAQMNRDFEKEAGRPPRLSDLKDCGNIEQDADQVGFLYEPKLSADDKAEWSRACERHGFGDDWSKHPKRICISWPKNRYGPTGVCHLVFQKSCMRYFDYGQWMKDAEAQQSL